MTVPITFPPKRRDTPENHLRGLWESLQRAGAELVSEGLFVPQERHWDAVLYFYGPLTPEERRLITNYIRTYADAAGWRIIKLRSQPRLVAISASNA